MAKKGKAKRERALKRRQERNRSTAKDYTPKHHLTDDTDDSDNNNESGDEERRSNMSIFLTLQPPPAASSVAAGATTAVAEPPKRKFRQSDVSTDDDATAAPTRTAAAEPPEKKLRQSDTPTESRSTDSDSDDSIIDSDDATDDGSLGLSTASPSVSALVQPKSNTATLVSGTKDFRRNVPLDWSYDDAPLTSLPLSNDVKRLLKSQNVKIISPAPFPLPVSIGYDASTTSPPSSGDRDSSTRLPKALNDIVVDTLRSSPLTTIQRVFLPLSLSLDSNFHCISPTGTGKTLAFGLGLLGVLVRAAGKEGTGQPRQKNRRRHRAGLILTPTRELAKQVHKVLHKIWRRHAPARQGGCISTVGGDDEDEAMSLSSSSAADLWIGTVGRTLARLKQLPTFCTRVSHVVLDECDVLTGKSFRVDMEETFDLLGGVSGGGGLGGKGSDAVRVWAFSATGKGDDRWWKGGVKVRVERMNSKKAKEKGGGEMEKTLAEKRILSSLPPNTTQIMHCIAPKDRWMKLVEIISEIMKPNKGCRQKPQCMIFFDTIAALESISSLLERTRKSRPRLQLPTHATLHSSLHQRVRNLSVNDFKARKSQVLLCTDVAGRGIDVSGLEYVVLYDFPGLEGWVHRSGRVGRSRIDKKKKNTGVHSSSSAGGVVYGFFDPKLQSVAPDVVKMLEDAKQWIDPKLRKLCT